MNSVSFLHVPPTPTSHSPRSLVNRPFDEALLPLLDSALTHTSDNGKTFFVVHTYGTHGIYANRYPHNRFSHFTEKSGKYQSMEKKTRQIVAEYDNAVLYHDWVIDQVLLRFQKKKAIVLYISDHGEEVFDDPAHPFHGHAELRASQPMVEIPMFVWASPSFHTAYPKLIQQITNSLSLPYMTDDIIHTVLDMLSISTSEFDPKRSLINPLYNRKRLRNPAGKLYHKTNSASS